MAKELQNPTDLEVIIRLRQPDEGSAGRDPDPTRDVFSVWIKNHPICPKGKAYRVAYTGPKVCDDEGNQIRGRICWLFNADGPGKKVIHKADLKKIATEVEKWQSDAAAIDASRANPEEYH